MVALRCIDQADVSQELLPGVTAQGFRELGSYIFVAPLDGVELYIDEAPAEAVQVDGQSGWRWTPGFYAGVVIAELLSHSGQRLAEYRLDVAPEGSKLGEGVFHTLLEELRAFDPALLFGTEAAQASIGVSGEVTSPLLAYARLRRHSDALQAALRAVMVRPLTRLQRERVLVPAHRVRRLDAASAVGLLRRPATVAYLNDEIGDPDAQAPLFEVTQSLRHCRQTLPIAPWPRSCCRCGDAANRWRMRSRRWRERTNKPVPGRRCSHAWRESWRISTGCRTPSRACSEALPSPRSPVPR
jgi:hypothetical protein